MNIYAIEATWKRRVLLVPMFIPVLIFHMLIQTPLNVCRSAIVVWRKREEA